MNPASAGWPNPTCLTCCFGVNSGGGGSSGERVVEPAQGAVGAECGGRPALRQGVLALPRLRAGTLFLTFRFMSTHKDK